MSEFYENQRIEFGGLNPCFTGICSMRTTVEEMQALYFNVLILVLLEYAL